MPIDSNIAARTAAETIASLIVDSIGELKEKHGQDAVKVFFGKLREVFAGELTVVREPSKPSSRESTGDPDVDESLELIDEALETIDDLPSRAQEFGESVAEKLRSIAETIEQTGEVTDKQLTAIENMRAGVKKWIR